MLIVVCLHGSTVTSETVFPDLYESSVLELRAGLEVKFQVLTWSRYLTLSNSFLSTTHFQAYFARINEVNLQGPALRAVVEMNPSALAQAAALGNERTLRGRDLTCMESLSS